MPRGATMKAAVAKYAWSGKVFVQYGMKRSGNHAISNWLLPKLEATEFNNVVPMGEVYAGNCDVPDYPEFLSWYFSKPPTRENAGRGPASGFGAIRHPVYATFEDISGHNDFFRENAPTRILVIRSFENMMSSRIRKSFNVDMAAYPQTAGTVMSRIIETWKTHAAWYLAQEASGAERLAIHFDSWCVDRSYRDEICRALSVVPGDAVLSRVSDTGGGSSFDGTKYDGDANSMAVDKRRDALTERERALLDQVMADTELRALADRVETADPHRQLRAKP